MARKWLNLFTGAALSFAVAGNALADEGKITVFAAASLTNAMQDIATQYKKEKGVDVVSSFASSSTLARQIEAGAPADLFISADQKWMDYAVDKKAIDTASRQTLLGNSLVVVAPKASEQKDFTIDSKTNWTSLLNGGRLAVGDPEHVPAGIYAKEALQKLGAWDTLSPKLAPAEDVRGALASLDIPRKRELLPYLQRLTREINIPMLYVSHSLDEILHLADRVMVLENGQVKAFGALEEVWGSSVMNPWLPKEQQSSILKVTVLEHHPHYAMTALALGDQHLWVNKLDEPLQAALRIRIQASDVSLVLQPPQQTSIRNVLRAKVVNSYDDNGQVEVELEVGCKTLWARISPWARDELAIKPGLWLYAQIKSVSITA